mmetsp:Transcript_19060/g.39437  ORF Transcript_19060/g.39437 Transcript_19060/m.39437 type:complete len:81 (+) Transcript_19060:178-420(+)
MDQWTITVDPHSFKDDTNPCCINDFSLHHDHRSMEFVSDNQSVGPRFNDARLCLASRDTALHNDDDDHTDSRPDDEFRRN